jgi:hypothetical protein
MRGILCLALALSAMASVALAEPAKSTGSSPTPGSTPLVLSDSQMDKVTAGVCIGNCPGQKTQIGVGVQASCVIGGTNCGNRQGQRQ